MNFNVNEIKWKDRLGLRKIYFGENGGWHDGFGRRQRRRWRRAPALAPLHPRRRHAAVVRLRIRVLRSATIPAVIAELAVDSRT